MKKIILSLLIVSGLSADMCSYHYNSYLKNDKKIEIYSKMENRYFDVCWSVNRIIDNLIGMQTECEQYKDDENVESLLTLYSKLSVSCSEAGY